MTELATRTCIKCNKTKPLREFYTKVAKDCKQCSDSKAKHKNSKACRASWVESMVHSLHLGENEY